MTLQTDMAVLTAALTQLTAAVAVVQADIVAPTTVTDAAGGVWSFGAVFTNGVDYDILKNGAAYFGGTANLIVISGGTAFVRQAAGAWFNTTNVAAVGNASGWQTDPSAPPGITASLSPPQ
jgi:hypothetical protein